MINVQATNLRLKQMLPMSENIESANLDIPPIDTGNAERAILIFTDATRRSPADSSRKSYVSMRGNL